MPSRTRPAAQRPTIAVGVGAGRRRGRPDVVGQLAARSCDVVALVAVLGDRLAAPERGDRRAEVPDLPARVVEVVLARDALAAGLEDAAQQVADERAAGVADVERPGRVGRHELDVDARAGSPTRAGPTRRARRGCPPTIRSRAASARRRLRNPGGATSRRRSAWPPGRRRARARAPPRAPWRSPAAPSGTAGRASSRGWSRGRRAPGSPGARPRSRGRAVVRQGGSAPAAMAASHARPISSLAVARIEDVRGWGERSVTARMVAARPGAAPVGGPPGPWYQSVQDPRCGGAPAGDCVLVHFAMEWCGQVHPAVLDEY